MPCALVPMPQSFMCNTQEEGFIAQNISNWNKKKRKEGGLVSWSHITDGEQRQAQYLQCSKDPSALVHGALYIGLTLPSPSLPVQHQWAKQWLSISITFHIVKRYPVWFQPVLLLPKNKKQGNPALSEAQGSLVPPQHIQSFFQNLQRHVTHHRLHTTPWWKAKGIPRLV